MVPFFQFFADLEQHRRNHANQNIDRAAMRGDGLFHDARRRVEVAVSAGLEKAVEDAAQESPAFDGLVRENIDVTRGALLA